MVEILVRIAAHAEALHKTPGTSIGRHRVGDDFVEIEPPKTIIELLRFGTRKIDWAG
jgi:hypothetical protein